MIHENITSLHTVLHLCKVYLGKYDCFVCLIAFFTLLKLNSLIVLYYDFKCKQIAASCHKVYVRFFAIL